MVAGKRCRWLFCDDRVVFWEQVQVGLLVERAAVAAGVIGGEREAVVR